MRQIKYRGKRVDNGGWVCGTPTYHPCGTVTITTSAARYGHEATEGVRFKVIPETVGQYTGKRDRHGVEMYRHDTVVTRNEEGFRIDHGYIEYCEERAAYMCYLNGSWVADLTTRGLEVTGNIHNKEATNEDN